MKKLLLIILALLMCLTACTAQKEEAANTGDASDNASETVETIPEDALLFTDESGAAAYTVISPGAHAGNLRLVAARLAH